MARHIARYEQNSWTEEDYLSDLSRNVWIMSGEERVVIDQAGAAP